MCRSKTKITPLPLYSTLCLGLLSICSEELNNSPKNQDNETKLSGYNPWGLSYDKSPVRNPKCPTSNYVLDQTFLTYFLEKLSK